MKVKGERGGSKAILAQAIFLLKPACAGQEGSLIWPFVVVVLSWVEGDGPMWKFPTVGCK